MSTPALVWIDSIQVGNSTAKSLLRYLATHNFHKPGFFFKNATYMAALEISEKTLQRSFTHLEEKNFITIERRFDENGRQISNGIYLNIPDEFLEKYEKTILEGVKNAEQNDAPNSPVNMTTLGASTCRGGSRQYDDPYNNNKTNNKINNKRESKKRSPLSPFSPNGQNTLLCQDLKLVMTEEMASFEARHKGEKSQYEFGRWLKSSKEYKDRNKKNEQTRPTMRDFTQERLDREANESKQESKKAPTIPIKQNPVTVVKRSQKNATQGRGENKIEPRANLWGLNESHGSGITRNQSRGTFVRKSTEYLFS